MISHTLQERNYWLDTLLAPVTGDANSLPDQVDVAVIGAGYTGLAAARALARSGARVAVLEAHTIGWGASSRNGGMVLTGLKLGPGTLIARYGRERARALFAASLAAIDCVETIVADDGLSCDFRRVGHLEAAAKPAHYAQFARAAETSQSLFNHPVRLVPRDALPDEIGSERYFGGVVDEASAGLNPARFVHGLALAAQKAGALLFESAAVEALERDTAGWRVLTSRGSMRATDVVVATSGYTECATPSLQRRIVPIGSYIIATEALTPELQANLIPGRRMVFDSKNFLYYFRLTPDGRMLFGGRAGFFPESASTVVKSAGILQRAMVEVFPQLRNARIAYAWGGTLDFAFDLMPHAGQLNGMWYALGYAGHGVALATYLGTALAAMIVAGRTTGNVFAELPIPRAPLGLYDGRPWFLPFAEGWYRLLDWVS
jgi:glycine/D-amino acid oxidase-like deaminating enzyme